MFGRIHGFNDHSNFLLLELECIYLLDEEEVFQEDGGTSSLISTCRRVQDMIVALLFRGTVSKGPNIDNVVQEF